MTEERLKILDNPILGAEGLEMSTNSPLGAGGETWFLACNINDVPENGGVCVKYNNEQIALFHFARRNEWYATQNECPHRRQMALSRGMIGSTNNEPKVACPFHKKTFSLITGECLSGDECAIKTYPVKVEREKVYIGIESKSEGLNMLGRS